MDVAEMKVAGSKKGSAKPNADVAKGNALAHVVVEWAWKEAEAEEKRSGKLALFVQSIGELSPEGHVAFRGQLSQELAALAELDKVSGRSESRTAGYSLASFRVMVSSLRTISEAVALGMKVKDKDGSPIAWAAALEKARDIRKAHVSANGGKTSGGRKVGAGRKALTDYDKAMRLVSKLNLRDLRKVQAAVAGLIEAAETGKRPKAAANQPAVAAQA